VPPVSNERSIAYEHCSIYTERIGQGIRRGVGKVGAGIGMLKESTGKQNKKRKGIGARVFQHIKKKRKLYGINVGINTHRRAWADKSECK
jgi:hypothetical protein